MVMNVVRLVKVDSHYLRTTLVKLQRVQSTTAVPAMELQLVPPATVVSSSQTVLLPVLLSAVIQTVTTASDLKFAEVV